LKKIDAIARKERIKPPGIIVVGEVVRLREKLRWFERKPFFDKKILVTRAAQQSRKFGTMLVEKGAQVLYAPAIEITPIEPNGPLKKAIHAISDYYAIIFTSVNSVSIFFRNLTEMGMDTRELKGVKVIPIGSATATLLRSKGIVADFTPQEYTLEGIIEVLKGLDVAGNRFLLPRAEEARDVLVKFITDQGGSCDVIPIYATNLPAQRAPLSETPDVVTFTSSSTADNFIGMYGRKALDGTLIASIGPITSQTLRAHGIPIHIEATQHDIPGLIEAMEDYFSE
jgi:uroporphyrinogen III methyltransferase/synthase